MENLLTANYWFDLRPESFVLLGQKIFLSFIVLLGVAALAIAVFKKRGGIYRGFLKRTYSFCLSNALIGLVLLFFNYEMVPFFAARFWLAIWLIIMLIWLFYILRGLKTIPAQKKNREAEKELKKYLP
jgi:amino acid transporter